MRNGHSKQARTHVKPVGLIALLTIASLIAHLPSRAGEYTSEQSLAQTVAINQPQIQGASLPQPLAAQLVQDMAWRSFVPRNEVRIVRTEEAVLDGCRDVAPPDIPCQAMGLPGWKVTIEAREHRFVYHATKAHNFKLNGPASVQVFWAEQKVWSDICRGFPASSPGICTPGNFPGWIVTTSNGQKRWVYHTGLLIGASLHSESSN